MIENLILVDARNRAIGHAEKHAAHAGGRLHRAFSIFLVDREGRLLLQRRHPAKYHSGGLWSNACCGHPRPGENTLAAAKRRLREELGATAPLRFSFLARYRAAFPNGLTENEIVHVYFALAPSNLAPNPDEIAGIAWPSLDELRQRIAATPEQYSAWLTVYLTEYFHEVSAGVRETLRRSRCRASAGKRRTIERVHE